MTAAIRACSSTLVHACVALLGVACAPRQEAPPAEPSQREVATPPDLVEHDLGAFGAPFEGYTVTAPRDAKLVAAGHFNWIKLSDEDRVAFDWAPTWADEVQRLSQDRLRRDVRAISATEIRHERSTLAGIAHGVHVRVEINGKPYRCYTDDPSATEATYSGPAMAEQIARICHSVRKRP